jgi:hypothetical protein
MFSLKNISDLTDEINLDNVANLGQKVKGMSHNQVVKNASWLLAGVALGSILARYFDPQEGQRRRTQIKDKAVSMGRNVQDATRRRIQDLGNRVRGVASQAEGMIEEGIEKRA